jgi:hypothetical protein
MVEATLVAAAAAVASTASPYGVGAIIAPLPCKYSFFLLQARERAEEYLHYEKKTLDHRSLDLFVMAAVLTAVSTTIPISVVVVVAGRDIPCLYMAIWHHRVREGLPL